MPREKQIRPIEAGDAGDHSQLELLRDADSFQPGRPPPPTPYDIANGQANEEKSYFSDSSDSKDDPWFTSRKLKFRRGPKKPTGSPSSGFSWMSDETSVNSFDHNVSTGDYLPPKPTFLARSASSAAAKAFKPMDKITKSTTWPWSQPLSPKDKEYMVPMLPEEFEHRKRRGDVPGWRLMVANRKKSREGTFLRNQTLHRPSDETKKRPERTQRTTELEDDRSKRDGTLYFG